MSEREGGPEYVFHEGPPTANGRPGIHHVLARAFKDIFPRYKTMQGYYIQRRGGWDTHGLPVEIEVEKRLGSTASSRSRPSASPSSTRSAANRRWSTSRVGRTHRAHGLLGRSQDRLRHLPQRVHRVALVDSEAVLGQNLLFQGYKIVPYCPRCGTPLSSHELVAGLQGRHHRSQRLRQVPRQRGDGFA
jgi:isoleucyl-tRNA synthetase